VLHAPSMNVTGIITLPYWWSTCAYRREKCFYIVAYIFSITLICYCGIIVTSSRHRHSCQHSFRCQCRSQCLMYYLEMWHCTLDGRSAHQDNLEGEHMHNACSERNFSNLRIHQSNSSILWSS
jgi:hypothetical protein